MKRMRGSVSDNDDNNCVLVTVVIHGSSSGGAEVASNRMIRESNKEGDTILIKYK